MLFVSLIVVVIVAVIASQPIPVAEGAQLQPFRLQSVKRIPPVIVSFTVQLILSPSYQVRRFRTLWMSS